MNEFEIIYKLYEELVDTTGVERTPEVFDLVKKIYNCGKSTQLDTIFTNKNLED